MIFQQPIWFLLLIPLACVLYYWRIPSRLLTGLRLLAFLLIVLAMVGPSIKLPTRSGTIIVVADRSRSMPSDSRDAQKHAVNLLLDSIGKEDRLGVVSFAEKSYPERLPSGGAAGKFAEFVGESHPDASDLTGALESALSLIPVGDKGRILVLSDGRWTGENPTRLVSHLVQRGVAVDYRIMERPAVGDVAALSIESPDRVLPDEVFKIVAWVQVPTSQDVEYELLRNGQVVGSGKRTMGQGANRLEFLLKAGTPGALETTFRVKGTGEDPIPENNIARKLIGVEGAKPVLLIAQRKEGGSGTVPSQLAEVLRNAGVETEVSSGAGLTWGLPLLSRYSAIIVENAPSSQIGTYGMELIAQWIKETGSGFMLTGGKNAFALGGYYQSPLDAVLPVSMELRKEHRKLAVAVGVLTDCSGSMGMEVPGGKIKMDLANLGAAEVLNVLTPMDEVLVLTCDTRPIPVLPLKKNTNPKGDRNTILRVGPGGGGIFVYTGLLETTKQLSKAEAQTKHIILFTDADDTEEPGDYVNLLTTCKRAGMTCSVIALGTEHGVTAQLCKDIAKVGGGSIYFTEQPNDLPRLFAQDTFTISRSTFIEDKTAFHFTGGMATLSGQAFSNPPKLGGYNLCYAKPGALPSAITDDEYKAPIVASWQAGIGRVLCYTGQVDGKFTGPMATWDRYTSMLASMGRWTAGRMETLPNNMMLTQHLDDGSCQIRLHLDPEREAASLETLPLVTVLKQTPGLGVVAEKLPMRWLEPELLGVTVPLTGSETVQATVVLEDQGETKPFQLAPVCLPYSPEFRPAGPGKGKDALKHLAATTGGVERIEIPGIWREIPKVPRLFDLSPWLLYMSIFLLVLEIFQRRTGWISAWAKRFVSKVQGVRTIPERERAATAAKDVSADKGVSLFRQLALRKERKKTIDTAESSPSLTSTSEPQPEKPKEPEKPVETGGVFDALQKAKKSSKNRTDI